mmetsp:Transcript_11359/g.28072  ORF Transcript_11359/g.28072 Transcript_11359/m.28072 type:complete len:230 (-) Transcript_11359:27-716(-)
MTHIRASSRSSAATMREIGGQLIRIGFFASGRRRSLTALMSCSESTTDGLRRLPRSPFEYPMVPLSSFTTKKRFAHWCGCFWCRFMSQPRGVSPIGAASSSASLISTTRELTCSSTLDFSPSMASSSGVTGRESLLLSSGVGGASLFFSESSFLHEFSLPLQPRRPKDADRMSCCNFDGGAAASTFTGLSHSSPPSLGASLSDEGASDGSDVLWLRRREKESARAIATI